MQGVSGSNPLGSILSDSLRRKGSFLSVRVSLVGPAGPKSAKASAKLRQATAPPQWLVSFWAS